MSLIYIVSGEDSGDILGAGLMKALKTLRLDVTFAGIGGNAMQREGLTSLFPYNELSVMGFWEILPHIPKFISLLHRTVKDIAMLKPDVIVTIDSPGFNFRLANMLKNNPETANIKRIHYVAPSVWAYKPGRARKTAQLFDLLLALLPFESPYFEKEGLRTVFAGHPVLWQLWEGNASAFYTRHGIAESDKLLLVLPGSRAGEVKRHLALFLAAVKTMTGFKIAILASPQLKDFIKTSVPEDVIVCGTEEKKDAFAAATLALSKSGTVTLELAAAGVPMVVAHTVSAVSAWIIRKMLLIKYASLVNIAVNKEIVPELIQERCTISEITQKLELLTHPEEMQRQRENVAGAIKILRGNNPCSPDIIAARGILEELKTS